MVTDMSGHAQHGDQRLRLHANLHFMVPNRRSVRGRSGVSVRLMRVLSTGKLKAFQLAGMTGSFKHAAHLLSISPSAVSARVRSLQRDLGARLFRRGMRRLTLTEAGAAYIHEVEATLLGLRHTLQRQPCCSQTTALQKLALLFRSPSALMI
jgi:Bacterial regulatory helix-turn-helix protein, lysR family